MQVLLTLAIQGIVCIFIGLTLSKLLGRPLASDDKDWVDILSAFSTPCVAAIAAWIGYRQWQTDEKARKAAHRQQYMDNYEKVANALSEITRTAKATMEIISNLHTARNEAKLCLSDEIVEFIETCINLVADLLTLQNELKDLPTSEERHQKARQEGDILKALYAAKPHLKYRKYLIFD